MPLPEDTNAPNPLGPQTAHNGSNSSATRSGLEKIPVLEEASSVVVQVELLKENYDEILRVIEANEWELEEGLNTMLLSGLGLQRGTVLLDQVNDMAAHGDAHASKRVDDIVRELAAYHSMYSVMKFKAFKLYKLNQTLAFNNSGLRAQEVMWQEWAERMRNERDQLNSELLRMRSLLSEFKLDWEESGAPPLPPGVFGSLKVKELENRPPDEDDPERPPESASQQEKTTSFLSRLRRFFGG